MLCVSAQAHLFTYLFICAMINCTVFWEVEMVHVKIKAQPLRRAQFGKQLEHPQIKRERRKRRSFPTN